ncbi:heterokaryon incompatibility protein [Colletotrichum scovillei]|uniref:Heterokaryon incompatibility protein n=1 Tax=Colletotrichum scovillei TaxID=1209932 RepID=A0A9P7UAK7_9PEZI|nr:heterokaryon incompatibility protein [Colletotrichum scovillei]KAG7059667.1 heterokaryon incompatibility protein [Colletotrichum scovillei]KAG7067117.1 heterokaryon incompatibility protein [Colletotrichum scovillei]
MPNFSGPKSIRGFLKSRVFFQPDTNITLSMATLLEPIPIFENQKSMGNDLGHIAYGRPVLYESRMEHFFQERYKDDWESVDKHLQNPWWSQTWAIPEAWCANDRAMIQCGQRTIKWKTLKKALPLAEV